jgi:hypothetical protein
MVAVGRAELRTLVDQFGRSIKADVLSVEGDIVKIKRDDGQLFDMPLKNLSDDNQAELKAWAQKNPSAAEPAQEIKFVAPSPESIKMSVSRGKFDIDVAYKSEYSQDSYEEWGYNVQLTNTTLYPIDKLRVEYNIFGRLYSSSSQRVQFGNQAVEGIGPRKSITFRTKSFRINKWKTSESKAYGGQLNGVWVRLYYDSTLLQEYSSPDSIKTKEKWTSVSD